MATSLTQGDIAIVHYQSDNPDTVSFILLADVDATTSVNFTDNGLNAAGQLANATEGTLTWTSGAAISAGTVVTLTDPGGTWLADVGSVAESSSFSLSATGDQVVVYQGPVAGLGDSPSLLFGAHFNNEAGFSDLATGWDTTSGTSNTSQLPAALAGFEIAFIPEFDNATYTGTTSGTKSELIAAITNDANWSTSNSVLSAPSFPAFTVTPDDLPGTAVDDAFAVVENATITAENVFSANPTTPDSDPDTALAVTQVEGNAGNVGNQITLLSGALLQLNADGTFTYDPNGVFEWVAVGQTATDTFTYQLTDSDTGTATVTVTGIDNDDKLIATAAVEAHDGGVGTNTISFENSASGVIASLGDNTGTNGDADGDTYTNIQNMLGSVGNDTLTGDDNDNVLDGNLGDDTLDGGGGNNTASFASISTGATVNLNIAGAQATGVNNDTIVNISNLLGGEFNDRFVGKTDASILTGAEGNDNLYGIGGDDILNGGDGNDHSQGGNGNDTLNGDAGDDRLYGGNDNDILVGGIGRDFLFGGAGADTFTFNDITESGLVNADRDIIRDFSQGDGDQIDLSGIDADTTAGGNDSFTFLGTFPSTIPAVPFTNTAGELFAVNTAGGQTVVWGDVDGDSVQDFTFVLDGTLALTGGDFIL